MTITTAADLATLTRNEAIARIRKALRSRSGKTWSVTGGRGTAWGWITVDAPPARRTWHHVDTGRKDEQTGLPVYEEREDPAAPFGHTGPDERRELGELLGLGGPAHHQGVSIAASNGHYREYVDRAEGREPSTRGECYWD
jgi:hypothetical protein